MMEHFVTIFDSNFLPQGLALHASMRRHLPAFHLWVICVDDLALELLNRLALTDCTPLPLRTLETPELLSVKSGRTRGEYCWTLTPFAPRFVFDAAATADRVTYLDADLWFRRGAQPIFSEFEASRSHVLITEHGYAAEHDQSATSGHYCVQFMTFNREGSAPVLQWWQERCIEWCFARHEGGKFGDQKYLDDWPERFPGLIHVLQRQEFAQAPWNAARFAYSSGIFFHFHGLRIAPGRRFDLGHDYALPAPTIRYVYEPYLDDLRASIASLAQLGHDVRPQSAPASLSQRLRRVLSPYFRSHRLARYQQGVRKY